MDPYENDIDYFIDVTPIMDEKNFILLLLADMASQKNGNENDKKVVYLPRNFKIAIETIMNTHEELAIHNFSKFINIKEYYDKKNKYEIYLDKGLYEALQVQTHTYDPEKESITVIFTEEEIQKIKHKYDQDILDAIAPISTLMNEYITKSMQEQNRNLKS